MQPPPAYLKAYLPAVSLRGEAEVRAPQRRLLHGSCLWLDMSGFTPLTERWSAEGPSGIERLSQTLNVLYATVARAASGAGGDVMFFAGDGALCLWEAETAAALPQTTWLAARAAQQLLHDLARASTSNFHFEVRQVLVAGEMILDTVGGELGAFQDVVSGAPLRELSQLGRVCRKGQVLLSGAAAAKLDGRARLEPAGDGRLALAALVEDAQQRTDATPSVQQTAITPAAATKMPGFLSTQLARPTGPQSELRRVSVVFTHWKNDGAVDAAELQRVTLVLQRTARRHHGWLCQLVQDDKGLTGIVVFGLPGHAQGEDGVRAVRFATDAAAHTAELGLRLRFGVATGPAFCGVRGGHERLQYCVLGNAVNRASRLAEHAASGPLVDEATFLAAYRRVDFVHHAALQLKGLTGAVETYRPGPTGGARTLHSQLVGFETERSELSSWLREFVVSGDNRPLVIRGVLGSGKTAFIGQIPAQCAESGIEVVTCQCDEFERHTGYFALRPVMRRLLMDGHAQGNFEWLRSALAARGQEEQLALLNPLLLANFEATPLVQQMSPETRSENRKQLMIALLRERLADRQVVVVIDDAHWLDAASAELLEALLPQLPSLAFVLSERAPDGVSHERLAAARLVEMSPLDSAAVGELVAHLAAVPRASQQLSEAIRQSAAGNPLHCIELSRALLASGRVEVTPGEVRARPDEQGELLGVPGTLEELIQGRFDRLSSDARDVLRTASVLGTVLDLSVLRELLGSRSGTLDAALEEAMELGIVRSRGTYQFEHASVHTVVYGLLLPSEQRQLHERAARALESVYTQALEAVAARLAQHWLRAGNAERAAHFSALAADQALQGYANRDAEHLFRQAIQQDAAFRGELAVSLDRARWSMLMGQALYSQSRHREARRAYDAALGWTGTANPGGLSRLPLTISRLLGRVLVGKLLRRSRAKVGAVARQRRILTVQIINAGLALDAWEGRLYDAANKALLAFMLSEAISDTAEAAETVAGLGYMLSSTPVRRWTEPQILRGLLAADATGDLQARTSTRVLLGMYYTLSGRPGRALEPLQAARAHAERLGSGLWRHRAWFGLGEALLCAGDLGAAERAFANAAEIAALAEPPVEGFANCMRALALWRSGDSKSALELVHGPRGCVLLEQECLPLQRFTSLGIAAELLLASGRIEEALLAAERAAQLSAERPDVNVFFAGLHGHTGVALVLLALVELTPKEHRSERRSYARRASAALRRLRAFARMYPAARPAFELLRGRQLLAAGWRRRARQCFQRALRLANATGQPFERALALHWLESAEQRTIVRVTPGAEQSGAQHINLRGSAWCRANQGARGD